MAGTRFLCLITLLGLAGACDPPRDDTTRKAPTEKRTRVQAADYFPLAVGNRWTYRRQVRPGYEPLYYYAFTIEEPGFGGRPAGTTYARTGRDVRLDSGLESFEVAEKTDRGFVIRSNEAQGLEPYTFQEFDELTWSVKQWDGTPVVWEARRGRNFGDTGYSTSIAGLLATRVSITDKSAQRTLAGLRYSEPVVVPAGRFGDVIANTIEFVGGVDSEPLTIERYFAARVGLVKETQRNAAGEIVYTIELQDYRVQN